MGQLLLLTIGALVVGAIGFGIAVLISGSDPGLQPVEPDGRAVPLPVNRPLVESDFGSAKFDTAVRGYRMGQVDTALRRAAYDIGYKQELIGVLEAEVDALRDGRVEEADKLRSARQAALSAIAGGPRPTMVAPDGEPGEPAAESAGEEPPVSDAKADEKVDEPTDIIESHGDRDTDAESTADGRQREMRLP
jgi:DivIVA domain-containing protein